MRALGSRSGRLLALLLVLSIQACGQPQPQTSQQNVQILRETISTLNIEDPESDLTRNLNAGGTRFVGIYGFTCTAPGVQESELNLLRIHGVKCLAGTSDAIEGIGHKRMIRIAENYARQYNLMLIERLRYANAP